MRVLHLFDAGDTCVPHTRLALLAASLGRLPGVEQDVCLMGNRMLFDAAAAVGIDARWRIGVPGGHAALGYFAVRAQLKVKSYDLVHCWSTTPMGPAMLAMLLSPSQPRVVTAAHLPTSCEADLTRLLIGEKRSRMTILATSSTIRREFLTRGVSTDAVHVLRPGVDMGLVDHAQRDALRKAWDIPQEGKVVALVSDPVASTDCVAAHMAVGLADELSRRDGQPLFLVVHGRQFNRAQAMHAGYELGRSELIIVDDRVACPWRVLPACDLALAMGPQAGGLGLVWAMTAGVPIIGEATYAVSEIVEDHHSALLAKPGVPKMLSHRIAQILADPQLAWKLKDTARHEAYSFFSRQQYVQSLGKVYEQVVNGQPIEVLPLQSTGGLRFAGRA